MKKNLIISSVLAAALVAGVEAKATTYTETQANIDYEIENHPYSGTFTDANLKSGSTVFNNTTQTITSAQIDLTILNDIGLPVTLTVDGITENMTPTYSGETLDFTLNATQDAYIQSHDGTFGYGVVVDCELGSAELVVNTTTTPPPPSQVPDGGSSVMMLGGAFGALGFLKRKMA